MNQNRRGRGSAWIGLRPSPGVVAVLVTLAAVFAVVSLLGGPALAFVSEHLLLRPRLGLGREPWQLLTTGFVHLQFGALISSGVAIWLFGTPVEQRIGKARLFRLLVGATLFGSLASSLYGRLHTRDLDVFVVGAGAASMATIAAFGSLYGRTPLLLFGMQEMRASTCAIIFLVISGVMYLLRPDLIGLVGAAAGAAYGAYGGEWLGLGRLRGLWDRFRLWRLRRRYKVIPGGRDTKRYLN